LPIERGIGLTNLGDKSDLTQLSVGLIQHHRGLADIGAHDGFDLLCQPRLPIAKSGMEVSVVQFNRCLFDQINLNAQAFQSRSGDVSPGLG